MSRRLRRRDLAPLAAGALAAWCVPAWAQEGGGATPPEDAKAKKPSAVDLAFDWLKRHQSPDAFGRWDSDGFTARCTGEVCGGPGDPQADPRATGLALQAFLGCGETHQAGEFRETVKEGLKYLCLVQHESGRIGVDIATPSWSNHVAAADALVEAYGTTQSKIFDDRARRAVEFAVSRATPTPSSLVGELPARGDVTTAGDLALLLRAYELAEMKPSLRSACEPILRWFAERTDPKIGAVRADDPKSKPDPLLDDDRATIGGLVRVWCPADLETVRNDALIARVADRLAAKPPVWSPAPKGRMSFAAWERRSQFLFQAHGEKHLAWNRALQKLLVEKQRLDGCARGSWDPVDAETGFRGRVESTALAALCCEWPYRWGWRLAPPKADATPAPPPPK